MTNKSEQTFDKVVQEVATEWLNKVLDAIETNNEGLLGEVVVPLIIPLALIKVEQHNNGEEWDLLRATDKLTDEILHTLNEQDEEEQKKSTKKVAKKAAKKATKKTTKKKEG